MRLGVVHKLDGLVDSDAGDLGLVPDTAAYHQHDAKLAQSVRKAHDQRG